MRELTSHKVAGLNDTLRIMVLDEPGAGGASHKYQIRVGVVGGYYSDEQLIQFQNGPIAEAGINGISNEALLAIVEDRLKCFQTGDYECRENGFALAHVQEAMRLLHQRTNTRIARGVEGTSQK